MKSFYVRLVRVLRGALRRAGLLGMLDQFAAGSQPGLWLRSILSIHDLDELVALDVPWWTFESAELVEAFLRNRPGAQVLEWGSGASTVWLARRATRVTTIEHHVAWAAQVRPGLPDNATLLLVEPEPRDVPAIPSKKPGHSGLDFERYVDAIDMVEGDFDLVVIDGRAREACFAKAMGRLAPGGMVVFDNVDRSRYRRTLDACDVEVRVTRGLTPGLPYPTRTALVSARG